MTPSDIVHDEQRMIAVGLDIVGQRLRPFELVKACEHGCCYSGDGFIARIYQQHQPRETEGETPSEQPNE